MFRRGEDVAGRALFHHLEYASSTRFYLEDQERLATRWRTPLPFPVQVVARVQVFDQVSNGNRTTGYRYHHGYWDGVEREFRGFGRVDQIDAEAVEGAQHAQYDSPPTETRTWFHLGAIGDEGQWAEADFRSEYWQGDPSVLVRPPDQIAVLENLPPRFRRDALRAMRGNVLRTELYALDGAQRQKRPYTVTEHLQGVREENAPGPEETGRLRIFFSHSLADRTTQWERGAYDQAVELLLPVRFDLWQIGGSHAQRDVVDWTLTEAAVCAGQRDVALSLAHERLGTRPRSAPNRRFLRRAEGMA